VEVGMKFSFSGRHMEVGEALTNRAKEACAALATKYEIRFIEIGIVMKKDVYMFRCDISAKTDDGNSYHAGDGTDDPHVSFDLALQKIEQQMKKKKKMERSFHKEHRVEINRFDNSLEAEEEGDARAIVAEIMEDLPLLSVGDATKYLNEQTGVFVFENISNNAVNVVYVRKDGNIGWIDYNPASKPGGGK
jgi:ribosomal subunit interface protein